MNTCLITSLMGPANIRPLKNIFNILSTVSGSISLIITSNENISFSNDGILHFYKTNYKFGAYKASRIFRYVYNQIKISLYLMKIYDDIDVCVFYMGETLIVPIFVSKLLGKKIIVVMCGNLEQEIEIKRDALTQPLKVVKKINMYICDKIIIYSSILIVKWGLEKFRDKIALAPEHYLNLTDFNIEESINKRLDLVGYIGRLGKEKGIINYMKAISLIFIRNNNLHFFVGGEGNLRNDVEKIIGKLDPKLNLEFSGWISHEELPIYLNKLKLIVLPSYTEGLPNMMLEAMACGTPVIATPVGSIPDIIKDGDTGFIMENNSPECIAANVIRALENPDLQGIAKRARTLVENEFTFDKAVERWRKILVEICED